MYAVELWTRRLEVLPLLPRQMRQRPARWCPLVPRLRGNTPMHVRRAARSHGIRSSCVLLLLWRCRHTDAEPAHLLVHVAQGRCLRLGGVAAGGGRAVYARELAGGGRVLRLDQVRFAVVVDHHGDGPGGEIDRCAFGGLYEGVGLLKRGVY